MDKYGSIDQNWYSSNIKTSTKKDQNTYCYLTDEEDAKEAHQLGLSSGKYQALLKLQSLGSDITAEKIKNMTMKEIHDLIHSLSEKKESSGHHSSQTCENRHQSTHKKKSRHHLSRH